MRKLTKKSLNELAMTLPVVEKEIQTSFVGGGNGDTYNIVGGRLEDTTEGVVFHSDSGFSVTFNGVDIATSYVTSGAAYQLNGTIHIDEGWLNSGFGISDFVHEYGHYLQQQEMSTSGYYVEAATSVWSAWTDPENHMDRPFEKEATQKGEEYWEKQLEKLNN